MDQPHEGMNCPVCNVGLMMSVRQNVEIDYCPKCRGVWLDRGELDKIIERTTDELAPAQEEPPVQKVEPKRESRDYDRERYERDRYEREREDREYHKYKKYKYKKKKHWLHELFD